MKTVFIFLEFTAFLFRVPVNSSQSQLVTAIFAMTS